MARRLPLHIDLEDLVSAGTIGLTDAAARFDRVRGVPFDAFAAPRIRGAMLDSIRDADPLSRDMRRLSNMLRDTARSLERRLNRFPDEDDIAHEIGVSTAELARMRVKIRGTSVASFDDGTVDLANIPDPKATDPFEARVRAEETEMLTDCIARLPDPMQRVLSLYFTHDLTLREVGEILGFTESRACQILALATDRLRGMLVRKGSGLALRT